MADTTKEVIFKINTNQAVESIGDLRENVKKYKELLEQLPIGTKQYSEALQGLQESQAALKNAMHATNVEEETQDEQMKKLARQANGLGTSYNALVKQMADLTQQFRATEDAERRADLGNKILAINQQLKEMDAMRGNFQRNVGDYMNQAAVDMKAIVRDLPSGLGFVKKGMDDVTKSMSLMGKQPIIGIVAMLAPLLSKIVAAVKENDSALQSVNRVMESLRPVTDFFAKILEKIAGWVTKVIDYVADLAPTAVKAFGNVVAGATGVGNAILQYLLTPIRTVIDAAKGLGEVFKHVFKGEFKEAANAAKSALSDIGDAWKKGFSFASNFAEGKRIGEQFVAGIGDTSVKKKAEEAGTEIGKTIGEAVGESAIEAATKALEKALEKDGAIWDKWMEEQGKELEKWSEMVGNQLDAENEKMLEEMLTYMRLEEEAEERRKKNRIDAMKQTVSATADLFGALADMMESGTDVTESEARKAKNLRIASATIDMFQGATTAYSTAQSLGVPMGPIVGAANAAAVIATGMANIAKIKSQNVSATGSAGATSPTVSTPSITPTVQQVRTITSASEEDRLNQMASDQRVFILDSDLEAAGKSRRVRVAETTF